MRVPLSVILLLISLTLFAQPKAEIIKLKQLQEHIQAKTDKVKVINFWATWCAPCIKEMPLFEKLNAERQNVEVTLVSMDLDLDPNPEKVYKFLDRRKIKSQVLILDERDPNSWIDQVDKNWSGALPATIIINGKTGKRKFIERELHEGELEKLIAEVL
ncbi:MAG: TlpA family protein disulfide reductase [Cyclobacteriaceae bacterium]|jgi:thiol-disulfide isomerase/thioredoxin|nr:TlpA family protein disulfide reductase [Cyclobacteriaceae bacterium]